MNMTLKQRLEMLDMCIQIEVQCALSSLTLKWYMDQFFYRHDDDAKKSLFKTNIANTYLYKANLSFFERNFLKIGDEIHEHFERKPKVDTKILHRWDLKNHRDYLSHPGKGGQFDNPKMKKFIEEKRYYKDRKAILIWNARRSILEKLTEQGSDRATKYPTFIGLHYGMTELVHGAIHYTLNDGIARPTISEVHEVLEKFFSEVSQHQSIEADRQYNNRK